VARLHGYTVYRRLWSNERDHDAIFLREGFCWGAFLFSVVWALWHRMWFVALGLAALFVGLALLDFVLVFEPAVIVALNLASALWVGMEAADWRRGALTRAGYVETDIVYAPSLDQAEHRFFERDAAPSA
jgi:hypothetical protein